MRSPAVRLPSGLALGLFLCFVLTALPVAGVRSWRFLAAALAHAGESPRAAERRVRGEAYVDQLDRIRRAIPSDGAYFLIDGLPVDEGAAYWVRFDLAPRKPLLLGFWKDLAGRPELAARLVPAAPGVPGYVVVARHDGEPPLLLDRAGFLAALVRR